MRKSVRRLYRHLTRSRARVGWLLFGVCAIVYVIVPTDVAKQFALVLAGVAAGAVFLPELSANLWTMRAEEIRQTMPDIRIRELRRELVAAAVQQPVRNEFIWAQVLEPLLSTVTRPLAVQWNPSYDVHLYLDQTITLVDRRIVIHRLETTSRSERILAAHDGARIWVSLARTNQALVSEFGKDGCLLRELVELPDLPQDQWRNEILKHCVVTISVNGEPLPLDTPEGENVDVIRWEAPVPRRGTGVRPGEPVPIMVSAQFPLSADVSTFPMIFGSYFCVGRTEITFTAYHPDPDTSVAVELDNFLSRQPGGMPVGEVVQRTPNASNLCGFNFSTSRNSVLWPGSGMLFRWEVGPDKCAG